MKNKSFLYPCIISMHVEINIFDKPYSFVKGKMRRFEKKVVKNLLEEI